MEKETEDRVREMAYLMWEQAGRQMGMAAEFWLAAEREVLKTMSAMAGACAPGKPADAEMAQAKSAPAAKSDPAPDAKSAAPKAEAAPAKAETTPAKAKVETAAAPAKAESKPKTTSRKTTAARSTKTKAS